MKSNKWHDLYLRFYWFIRYRIDKFRYWLKEQAMNRGPIIVLERAASKIGLSFYLGRYCEYCNKIFNSIEDLEDRCAVFAGRGKIACKKCWIINEEMK